MIQLPDLRTPWRLWFDRDGTEDYGVISDADIHDIAASHVPSTRLAERTFDTGTFWRPENEGDEMPLTIIQLQLMAAAPELLTALDYLLDQTIDQDLKNGVSLNDGQQDARQRALAAIAKATGGLMTRHRHEDQPGREPTNTDRAGWAKNSLAVFTNRTFSGDYPDTMNRDDLKSAVTDLICDLIHYARHQGFDAVNILRTAFGHFGAELLEEELAV